MTGDVQGCELGRYPAPSRPKGATKPNLLSQGQPYTPWPTPSNPLPALVFLCPRFFACTIQLQRSPRGTSLARGSTEPRWLAQQANISGSGLQRLDRFFIHPSGVEQYLVVNSMALPDLQQPILPVQPDPTVSFTHIDNDWDAPKSLP